MIEEAAIVSEINDDHIDLRKHIYIKGAQSNNLKNIDVIIPKKKLIVVTGLSGSGKSSLIMDTLVCRRTKKICRKPFKLCATVSHQDEEA